jgi:L-asparaginase
VAGEPESEPNMIGRATMEREVLVLATGGTIAMRGARAVPSAGPSELLHAAGLTGVHSRELLGVPGPQVALHEALLVARTAAQEAAAGMGVVVTHGTDTLEETAVLCDLLHDSDAPIVFTGAIRPASAPGADGPANLMDAVAVAGAAQAAGLGCVVVFGGEIHAARGVRKVDSSGPSAFGSPGGGPLGRVVEGRLALRTRPVRPDHALAPDRLDFHVPVIVAALGDELALLDAPADGAVVATLGGGHLSPAALEQVRAAAQRMPVVLAVRPERGAMLTSTYGFHGAEGDLRASGAIPAGALSPQAARMKLLACLGCGLSADELARAFANDDP